MRVAVGGQHLENAVVQLEDGDIERSAAEIVDRNDSVFAFVETVGQGSGGRLIDQPQNFEAGDAAGVFGGLALRVIKIGGHGDHGFADRLAEKGLGVLLELAQNHGRDFGRSEGAVSQLQLNYGAAALGDAKGKQLQLVADVFESAAHQALYRVDGALGVRGQQRIAICPGNDLRAGQVQVGDQAVGGTEVDADNPFGGSEINLKSAHDG